MPKTVEKTIRPRFRVLYGEEIALGPGKIDLLEQIEQTGSIAEAAKQLDMSYMRAWSLIKTMERCFKQPLVQSSRGGNEHGGARLTDAGLEILKIYREMEKKSLVATKTLRARLERHLK
jgi:molybdate transport system regulatory protein